jgi:xanthine dehydrogenase accessory factor
MKVLAAAVDCMRAGTAAALVTVIGARGSTPRSSGARMLVRQDGTIVGTVGGGAWEHHLIGEALAAIAAGRPRRSSLHLNRDLGMCCGGAMEAYVEPLELQEDLVIYGAGHVGRAVARLATELDYRITVVDERAELLDPTGFPEGVHLREADPLRLLAQLPQGPRSLHLVVTHSHQLDQDIVERLLPLELGWLGLIASRTKVARFLLRYRAAGMDPALFSRLSSPVGLPIGAETPAEIALSVMAELVARRRGAQASAARGEAEG